VIVFLLTAAFLIGWAYFMSWVIKKSRSPEEQVAADVESLQFEGIKTLLDQQRRMDMMNSPGSSHNQYADLRLQHPKKY
jgi:hypothetical protein